MGSESRNRFRGLFISAGYHATIRFMHIPVNRGGGQVIRILCFLAIVGFVSTPRVSEAQTWAEYRPAGIGYSIDMPGEWTITTEDVQTAIGSVKMYNATVDMGSVAFMSAYIAYPPAKVRGKAVTPLLDGARDGAVSNIHGTLRSEERMIVSNLPARQIIVDAPERLVATLRFFMLSNILVQAVVVGYKDIELQPNTKRFLASLKVVGEQ
jgi:hypothetical protein